MEEGSVVCRHQVLVLVVMGHLVGHGASSVFGLATTISAQDQQLIVCFQETVGVLPRIEFNAVLQRIVLGQLNDALALLNLMEQRPRCRAVQPAPPFLPWYIPLCQDKAFV